MFNKNLISKYLLPIIFLVSATATLGSLYFSEILKLPPCVLCWYQRIFMYPIAFISAIGIYKKDKNSVVYILALSLVGLTVAIYHNLLYYGILPESIQPCTLGVSCTTRQLDLLGFISIPLMSLAAFVLISLSSLLYIKMQKK
ncbi:MAG: putative disulfide formation protein [Candidatus Levybacteria bacterium GW2011_GWA2_40_8]|nr:MAG: putative disulfide formation protein [Candidatus Levybacteria bacterium GW2011_GWA2_40_8]